MPVPPPARPASSGGKKVAWILGGLAAFVVLGIAAVALIAYLLEPSVDPRAVSKAQDFLGDRERGSEVLRAVHLTADYHGHEFVRTKSLGEGAFAVVYRFNWDNDGVTDIAFQCDRTGFFEKLNVVSDNAGPLAQPFLAANLSIQVLGNLFVEGLGDSLTAENKQKLQKFVDDADAKGGLESYLMILQSVNR
ncbi:MAG TPA: hypothetical protein VGN17_06435 [Bryobacteraceae bacterium]